MGDLSSYLAISWRRISTLKEIMLQLLHQMMISSEEAETVATLTIVDIAAGGAGAGAAGLLQQQKKGPWIHWIQLIIMWMKDWFPQALIHYIIDYGKCWMHGYWRVFGVLLRTKYYSPSSEEFWAFPRSYNTVIYMVVFCNSTFFLWDQWD